MSQPSSTTRITRFPQFFYHFLFFNQFFSLVGSPLPDIQCPLVLLPATLLVEHGGWADEVLWQGNHHKVISDDSSFISFICLAKEPLQGDTLKYL